MTGWVFLIALCALLAGLGIIALIAMAAGRARRAWRHAVWRRAYRLAAEQPDVVVQVEDENDIQRRADAVATVDAMNHADLVDQVLADEQEQLKLQQQLEITQSTATAQIAVITQRLRDKEDELARQEAAKQRLLVTIKRMRREAAERARTD